MLISHHGPRDLHRRKTKALKKTKRCKNKRRNGRKPRNLAKEARGCKYMSHVLSYINEEENMIDSIVFDTTKSNLSLFDRMYALYEQNKEGMVNQVFGEELRKQACKEEYLTNIAPNLNRENYSNFNPSRLYAWAQIAKMAMPEEEECARILAVHGGLVQFTKAELFGMQEIFTHYKKVRTWLNSDDRETLLGEKCCFTLDEARAFVKLVNSHKLGNHLYAVDRVFDHSNVDTNMDTLYYEACDMEWRSGKCSGCSKAFWNGELPEFVACREEESSCRHCSECLLKLVKENIASRKPAFCCGKKCNCLLNVPQIIGGMEFFEKNLDISREKLNEMVVSNFCELALKPWRLLSGELLSEPQKVFSFESQNRRLGEIILNSAPFTPAHRKEKEELHRRVTALVRMTKCKNEFPALDQAVDSLVDAIKSRTKDEDMLAKCDALVQPIRKLLQNRAKLDEDANQYRDANKYMSDLLGMTMSDIVNMKLQRAKDALTTAYSIARTCKICTSTCKYDEEQLVTLHSGLDTDVKEWKWNGSWGERRRRNAFRLPCFACKDCVSNYLKFKSSLGKPALKCPGMNCECFLKESEIKAIAPVAYADYQAAIMRFALKRVKNFRTCPNSCCSAGLVLDIDCNVEKVTCTACNFEFCPHCNDLPHEGKTCDEMRRQRHAERWGDSKDFMENETKQCPFCLAWIEKNGGCNHMTCNHCRGEFCWLCFGDWKTHQDCEHKEVVVRRPFNELFPDWLSKPTKTLRPRFAVGNYVSWTAADGKSLVGRVLENDAKGSYDVELVNSSGRRKIDESLLRGFHDHIQEDGENSDDDAYASFLSGFQDNDDSGDEKEYTCVELTLKDASCCSCGVKTEVLSPNECDSIDFTASNPDEVQRLLKKYAVKSRNTMDLKSVALRMEKEHLCFNQLRKFRAEQEKIREAGGDSDDESSCACTLFSDDDSSDPVPRHGRDVRPCHPVWPSDAEVRRGPVLQRRVQRRSDDESSSSTPITTILELSDSESDYGFSSDDSESDTE